MCRLLEWAGATRVGLLILCMPSALLAHGNPRMATGASTQAAPCSFSAFVKEADPAGLNVRAAPRTTAAVLGRLPPGLKRPELGDYVVKVEVDVWAAERGWFEVGKARDNTALTGQAARRMFSGRGWVSGVQLTAKTQARQGYSGPSSSLAVVLSLRDGAAFDSDAFVNAAQLVSCQGPWALLEFAEQRLPAELSSLLVVAPAARSGLPPGRVRAWFVEICGNQESSCDGTASQEVPKSAAPKPGR